MNKRKRRKKRKSTVTLRAFLSAVLVVFALCAANLSFMSYSRDVLVGAITNNMDFEDIKKIGIDAFNGIKAYGKEKNEDNEDKEDEDTLKIVPPELFLPEAE